MLTELMTAFNALPGPLQTLCSRVALGTVNKFVGIGIDALREKEPGAIFARVCKDWQANVAADQDTLATAFEEFFASKRTQDELEKVLRGDFIDVDFDLLERELHEAGERADCPVQGIKVVHQLNLLFEDLNDWLEELPEYRVRHQIALRKTLDALHRPEADIPNYSLARRRYLERVIEEHFYVKFVGTAELGGPSEVGIRQVYVVPRLIAERDSGHELREEPEAVSGKELLTADSVLRKVVILGAPGSGKSTLGQWMALSLASAKAERAGGDQPNQALLPIFYRIRYLKEDLAEVSKTKTDATLWDCLHRRASQLAGRSLPPKFIDRIEKRHGLLIFLDGLDEAADQSQAVQLISGFAGSLGDRSRVIITTRPFEYRDHFSPKVYRHYELQEFDDDEVREFIDKWRESRGGDKKEAQCKANQLWSSLEKGQEIRALAGNALLLTMIVRVHFGLGELPDNRVELYDKCAETLLKRWADAAELGPGPLDRYEKMNFLARLAFEMQAEQEEKLSQAGVPLQISESELRKRLSTFLRQEKPGTSVEEVVRRLQTRDAILVDYGKDHGEGQFGFIHRSFQEYFAAWWMKTELSSDEFRDYEDRPAWRETLVMAVAQLEGSRGRKAIVDLLVRNKSWLAAECARAGKVDRWLDILARYLAKYHAGRDLDLSATTCAEACAERPETPKILKALFERETRDGRALASALELAEVLTGRGNETAEGLITNFFQEAKEFGLDSTEKMVLVGAGEFLYQEGERVDLPSFWIDKHVVTNRDYECMVPSHRDERDEYSNADDQPVIYVNWYEASLFCRWRGDGFRLPTEQEWEKAASWDASTGKKRRYPWEGDFDSARCNTYESGIRKTTPVGSYPNGVSPYGCEDMAGNVWEWCINEYHHAERTQPGGTGSRVLRGGSWIFVRGSARADARVGSHPSGRNVDIGFRVVCSSPIPER